MNPDDLTIIGLDEGDESHALYDVRIKMPVDKALVASVAKKGVLEPVLVRKEGNKVVVIDGRQRVRAAREANKSASTPVRVPTVVHRVDDAEAHYRSVELNELRTADDIGTKIKKAQALLDRGYTEEEASQAFGVTVTTIKNWLTLGDCAPQVRAAVEQGTVRMTDAVREIAQLPRAEQVERVKELAVEKPTRKTRKETGEKGRRGQSPVARMKVLHDNLDDLSPKVRLVLRWVFGEATKSELVEGIPDAVKWIVKKR